MDSMYSFGNATPINELSTQPDAEVKGCYLLFVRPEAVQDLGDAFAAAAIQSQHVIYVGESGSGANSTRTIASRLRNHRNNSSGNSAFRRTLGAVLRERLMLVAISGQNGKYRFDKPSERRLTQWIVENVRGIAIPSDDPGASEKLLIGQLDPPLNTKHWANPLASDLYTLRKRCINP